MKAHTDFIGNLTDRVFNNDDTTPSFTQKKSNPTPDIRIAHTTPYWLNEGPTWNIEEKFKIYTPT